MDVQIYGWKSWALAKELSTYFAVTLFTAFSIFLSVQKLSSSHQEGWAPNAWPK